MNDDDTREAIKLIRRDLDKWSRDKADAQALLIKVRAEIEYLEPELSTLRAEVYEMQKTKGQLLEEVKSYESRRESTQVELTNIEAAIVTGTTKLEDLDQQYKSEQARIDDRLSSYEQEQRDALRADLEEALARQESVQSEAAKASQILQDLHHTINHESSEFDKSIAMEKARITELNISIGKLRDANMIIEGENRRLTAENEGLLAQKLGIQIEYANLSSKVEEFKHYEEKAWAVLRAKDASLQQRESDLNERENLRPPKSFLPPINA